MSTLFQNKPYAVSLTIYIFLNLFIIINDYLLFKRENFYSPKNHYTKKLLIEAEHSISNAHCTNFNVNVNYCKLFFQNYFMHTNRL